MSTFDIHIKGIVQGVGFRPKVFSLATAAGLRGSVSNGNDGLHILLNAEKSDALDFAAGVVREKPPGAVITDLDITETTKRIFAAFNIVPAHSVEEKSAPLSPDRALCASCREELYNRDNRRFRYPFITCTSCGPRYSITKDLPYDRDNTAMREFTMCATCAAEYASVGSRRFYSQTNSCADCGISMRLFASASSLLSTDTSEIFLQVAAALERGKIIAVKGLGGYLLLCDAGNSEAVARLRSRKRRPKKPLAIMYPDLAAVQEQFTINGRETALLQSAEAPIVLLRNTPGNKSDLAENIAPGLARTGVMLPCTALLSLISTDIGRPLVATSANISGSPILFRDEDALQNLFDVADLVVSYNRAILMPQDDSVVMVSDAGRKIILRRARGYAPAFLSYRQRRSQCIFSAGALLKSSFTLAVNGQAYVSQFLGSGESFDAQEMYRDAVSHLLGVYNAAPVIVAADFHPDYFSRSYAAELADRFSATLLYVQHHEAHFAAVLAENNLLHSPDPVLGVIWDGTGLGNDEQIWGGEFFRYESNCITRTAHLDYFPIIAGDKTAHEPRLSALCTAFGNERITARLRNKFSAAEWHNYTALLRSSSLMCSSAGRVFDAVAALLNLCDKQTFEGEAAMYVEALAAEHVAANGFEAIASYADGVSPHGIFSVRRMLDALVGDLEQDLPLSLIAAKFHYTLVCIISKTASNLPVSKICFSGGVFQNALLVDWLEYALGPRFELFFHRKLSPNDENISFGQMVFADHFIRGSDTKDNARLNQFSMNSSN